jgi:anti-sigma28 factor (negative regulator of flagellin synthesis)
MENNVKIDATRLEPISGTQNAEAISTGNKPSGSAKSTGIGGVEDSVGLSPIGRLAAKIDNLSEERLEELRRKVADGSYHVDAQKISEKLVASMLEK